MLPYRTWYRRTCSRIFLHALIVLIVSMCVGVCQLVPLLRWMPAVWTRYVLYLGHLPLELLSQVQSTRVMG